MLLGCYRRVAAYGAPAPSNPLLPRRAHSLGSSVMSANGRLIEPREIGPTVADHREWNRSQLRRPESSHELTLPAASYNATFALSVSSRPVRGPPRRFGSAAKRPVTKMSRSMSSIVSMSPMHRDCFASGSITEMKSMRSVCLTAGISKFPTGYLAPCNAVQAGHKVALCIPRRKVAIEPATVDKLLVDPITRLGIEVAGNDTGTWDVMLERNRARDLLRLTFPDAIGKRPAFGRTGR
jgi:hypothetical protein